MKTLFNGLLQFEDNDSLETMLKEIDKNLSLKLLEFALDHAQKNGVYDFQESHLIYRCLEKLKKNDDEKI
jgi:hypothetical protein